jgi:DNA (cytosine-5)-methyltransferase 1
VRVLDLFCGAGGAAVGIHRAWPEAKIVGVDIKPQKHYPFVFCQLDAMSFEPWTLKTYDFIWASPPCQRYSVVTPKAKKNAHPDLLGEVFNRLIASGVPFVVENVPNARSRFTHPVMLCGSMFGLRCRRHRIFEAYFNFCAPKPCDHSVRPLLVTTAGVNSRNNGNFKSVKNAPLAYGIDWMTGDELKEAIPPAYSEYIAKQYDLVRHRAPAKDGLMEEQ